MADGLRAEYLDWYHALLSLPAVPPDVVETHRAAAQERFEESVPFLDSLPMVEGCRVLDVGLGYGLHCRWFAEKGESVTGISMPLTEESRRHAQRYGYKVEEADMHCTGLPDGSFDLVWSHHSLEHSFSPFGALLEWRRLLRPAGYLAVTVPHHKTEVVSGHFIVGWTVGQLIYLLGCTGYDIAAGRFLRQGYNVRALVRKQPDFDPTGKSYLCQQKALLPPSLRAELRRLPQSLGGYAFEGEFLDVTAREAVRPPAQSCRPGPQRSRSFLQKLVGRVRRPFGRRG